MIKFAKESDAKEFIIATETGMLHRLKKDNPDKIFLPRERERGLQVHEDDNPRKGAEVPQGRNL